MKDQRMRQLILDEGHRTFARGADEAGVSRWCQWCGGNHTALRGKADTTIENAASRRNRTTPALEGVQRADKGRAQKGDAAYGAQDGSGVPPACDYLRGELREGVDGLNSSVDRRGSRADGTTG